MALPLGLYKSQFPDARRNTHNPIRKKILAILTLARKDYHRPDGLSFAVPMETGVSPPKSQFFDCKKNEIMLERKGLFR
ncbi:MAG: hypothetical protein ACYTEO_07930 [Planctomycetota bacterium]|jgi:hypothetical protein